VTAPSRMTAPSAREVDRRVRARSLAHHIVDQVDKRQYLNAAHAASELVSTLLEAFGSLLHPESPAEPSAESVRRCCVCNDVLKDSAPFEDRWSWGPDGLHCHARCEDEFRRRYLRPVGMP
jgi:hypothetical protein